MGGRHRHLCELYPEHIADASLSDLRTGISLLTDHVDGDLCGLCRRHGHSDVLFRSSVRPGWPTACGAYFVRHRGRGRSGVCVRAGNVVAFSGANFIRPRHRPCLWGGHSLDRGIRARCKQGSCDPDCNRREFSWFGNWFVDGRLSRTIRAVATALVLFGVHCSADPGCSRDLEDARNCAQGAVVRRSFHCAAISSSREIFGAFLPAAVGAFATFAVLGFYTALVPTLLEKALQNKNQATAGGIVGELFLTGTIAIALTPRLRPHRGLLIALIALLPSLGFLVAAEMARSIWILLIGTAVGGIATGVGYRCSLQKVNESAPEDKRSEIVSAYLIACYAGISLPVIGIALVAKATGPAIADAIFGAFIGLLALLALIVEWKVGKSATQNNNPR